MALNETDRLKLAEIERQLERDRTIARAFGARRRLPWKSVGAALCALLAYVACVATVSLVTGAGIPAWAALPPVAVMVALLCWPGLLRLPVQRGR